MAKITPIKPVLLMLYGYPGSGKTFFARQLSEQLSAAHVQVDRIRNELFEKPTYSKEENQIVMSIVNYMTSEFLSAGVSVIYDTNVVRLGQRRALRNLATRMHAEALLLWMQIDVESAFTRVAKRDRRRIDDKYARPLDRTSFDQLNTVMQNPAGSEQYLVISGKHVFNTQKSALVRKLHEMAVLSADATSNQVTKPGMVNLVPKPNAGRVDMSRRNISIRNIGG